MTFEAVARTRRWCLDRGLLLDDMTIPGYATVCLMSHDDITMANRSAARSLRRKL